MSTRNFITTCLLATALSASTVLVAAPAQAAWENCDSGYACLWTGTSYPGEPQASFASNIVLSSSNNKINSVVNNGNYSVARFYDTANMTGGYIYMNNPARGGQSRDPLLSNGTDATTVDWSDRISSAQFV